jgi:hypothetical protein
MVELEVIPLNLLGRPRVDVTLRISGLFRDAFPQLVGWMNQATDLVAVLDEPADANPLAAAARVDGHNARVYGSAPGAYGAGLQAAGFGAITTEICTGQPLFFAEQYHQQYLAKPGSRPYCSAQPTGVPLGPFPGARHLLPEVVWQSFDWTIPHCVLRGDNAPIPLP